MVVTKDKIDRLYELLPVVYRNRDAERGGPLRELLRVIAGQVKLVEADIERMYDNWFIETCEDWVVPYIGDLVGYQQIHEAGEPSAPNSSPAQARNKILIPRRDVADTIHNRRRKGTLALLEDLAADVTGWPTRAVEFRHLLTFAQSINSLRMERGRTVDVRDSEALDLLNNPFDRLAHTVDVRRINSNRLSGRYNLPSLGLFAWRLKSYSVTKTPAHCLEDVGAHCFTFNVLGNDTPLFIKPMKEPDPAHIAEELNVPAPIRRRALEKRVTDFYSEGRSFFIYEGKRKPPAKGKSGKAKKEEAEIDFVRVEAGRLVTADLSEWRYLPTRGKIAVDPVRGRLAFPPGQLPKEGVKVSYHYGFSADIGGGEYARNLFQSTQHTLYQVGKEKSFKTINEALNQWKKDLDEATETSNTRLQNVVIEIMESGVFTEPLDIQLGERQSLQIRATNRVRPVLQLLDWKADRPDSLTVNGEKHSRFTLDGVILFGRGMQLFGEIAEVVIRHSTLVPGWTLENDCEPKRPNEPSLEIFSPSVKVRIEHSSLGTIQVQAELPDAPDVPEINAKSKDALPAHEMAQAKCQGINGEGRGEGRLDPICIHLSDSILDATDSSLEALGAPGCPVAHAVLTIERSTVIGSVQAHAIVLGQDTIFDGKVFVARSQIGCLRFCYVTPLSRTPRRFQCQPDLVEQGKADAEKQSEREGVRPRFESKRYGAPTYCRLSGDCAAEITRGAEDESEMGVYHDLYQPQRAANLRARLNEYVPAGTEAGIIYAN